MLRASDHLEVNMNDNLNENDLSVLSALYLPLIKDRALTLYNVLVMIANKKVEITNHKLLVNLTGLSVEAIEDTRMTLEKFGLVKTYYNAASNKYIIVVIKPKEANSFLKHEVYGRLYLNTVGEDVCKLMKNVFAKTFTKKSDYIELTCSMNNLLKDNWNSDYEDIYNKIKKDISNSDIVKSINFNYDIFLDGFDAVWPKNKRSKESLETIGDVATLYGISEKVMRRIVSRSFNPRTNTLNIEKLKANAVNSKAKYESSNTNVYAWPPKRFLESKQPNTPISKNDMEIIEMLLNDYRFNSEVCNVLIEYVLNTSDNKLIKKYVESIAASWSRSGVDTYDKAKAKVSGNVVDASVAWSNNKNNKEEKKRKLSEEERQALIDNLKGASRGKN